MSNVTILVGAQWGDEGKGKWIDILAKDARIVARYQGGNNAGHTLYVNGEKIVLHQIPSGIFQPQQQCALAAGVVINPAQLVEEIKKVSKLAVVSPERLWLSARAHVISPWHIYLDGKKERESENPIGTTKRGIGPTYSEKAARSGLRLGDYIQTTRRLKWIEDMRKSSAAFAETLTADAASWDAFHNAAEQLAPFVCDAESRIRHAIYDGQNLLLEGAQGALLDINHGTYPYVTSSSTASGGAFASVGFSPRLVRQILGVGKAYTTRVGEGAFPTELKDAAGQHMATKGNEFGATTGRPRRCGWFDAVAMRYCKDVNGFDGIILNKMDILTGLPEIKIAVAYEHPKLGRLTEFPWDHEVLAACQPVYETYRGWDVDVPKSGKISDLPQAAQEYVKAVEKAVGCPVLMVGTGVNRSDALYR